MKENNRHTGMFVQPMIDYKSDEWIAMFYGWSEEKESELPFLVGFVFKTEKYAREFFDLLKAYNNGESIDKENNIRISMIVENPTDYSVYVYPSDERENVQIFEEEMEEEHGPEHNILITNITMCKQFPYGSKSSFKTFKERYTPGRPIEISAYVLDRNHPKEITNIKPIIKYDLKITNRKLLSKKDDPVEYEHGRKIMNLK